MAIQEIIYLAILVLCTSTIAVILGNEALLRWKARRVPKHS